MFALLMTVSCAVARAQTSTIERFEAASVKPNVGTNPARGIGVVPGRLTATGVVLADLVRYAYGFNTLESQSQVVGGPSWLATARFDIVATAAGAPTLGMLKATDDRFKLRAHVESPPASAPGPARCGILGEPGSYRGEGTTIAQIARALGNVPAVGRVVIDNTGRSGAFDRTLQWTPSFNATPTAEGSPVANPDAANGTSLFTALREQLGLKLEPQRRSVDVLVIDCAELPTTD